MELCILFKQIVYAYSVVAAPVIKPPIITFRRSREIADRIDTVSYGDRVAVDVNNLNSIPILVNHMRIECFDEKVIGFEVDFRASSVSADIYGLYCAVNEMHVWVDFGIDIQ